MTLNKAIVTGKIVDEPETRFTNSDEAVTRLYLETGEKVRLRLACWRGLSEQAKNLKDGDIVMAVGNLITASYKTNSGQNRKDFELNVRELYKLSGQPENLAAVGGRGEGFSSQKSSREEDLSDILVDEEIPF